MSKKTIIIIGAGKGNGNAIAKEFASHDFRVVLMARAGKLLDGKLIINEEEAEAIRIIYVFRFHQF